MSTEPPSVPVHVPSGSGPARPLPLPSARNGVGEERTRLLGDPKAVFVATKILGKSLTSQGKLGRKSQEVQEEAS